MRSRPRGRVFAALLVPALLGPAACDAAPDPTPPSPATPAPTASATLAVPPLRLPRVAAGADCPTTPQRPWSGPGQATAVIGEGPLYPVAGYLQDGTLLRLREQDRRPDGRYEAKLRWIGAGYAGPVLIRADRIDGEGTAGVRFLYRGEQRDGGQYAELESSTNDLPATTTVSGPGCYAYQVDGTTFSTTIVFRAA